MFNEELERLINAALADGKITESEQRALEKKAESLGVDLDEFNLELTSRLLEIHYGKSTFSASEINEISATQSANNYIEDFKKRFNKAEVYAPTGKYGKMELDRLNTIRKKMELVKTETPSTPEQMKELILFLDKLNDYGHDRKILSLIDDVDEETLMRLDLKKIAEKYRKMMRKRKRSKSLMKAAGIITILLIIGIIVGIIVFLVK